MLRSMTSAVLRECGFELFTYFALSQTPNRCNILVATYPAAWVKRYTAERYDLVDPVIHHARTSEVTMVWHSAPADASPRQRQLFAEAAAHGIRCGFVIPFRGAHGEFAAFAVAGDDPEGLRRSIALHGESLKFVGAHVHLQAQQIYGTGRDGAELLTPRERECLRWVIEGKSAWEISRILGISRRTVSFHLDNAKGKLKVRTLREAAIRLALNR